MHWGAAAGIGPGEQCSQRKEAECEWQAAGRGTLAGQRGGVFGLGLSAATWARGISLSPAGPRLSGRHSMGAISSPVLTRPTNFFALGLGVQRGGCRAWLGRRGESWLGSGLPSARATDLSCPESKLANWRPEEKYKHTLSHKLATHLAGI